MEAEEKGWGTLLPRLFHHRGRSLMGVDAGGSLLVGCRGTEQPQ